MAVISGDGVFSHVFLGTKDVATSAKFYDAALAPLGVKNMGPFGNGWMLYGKDKPALVIGPPGDGAPPSSQRRHRWFRRRQTRRRGRLPCRRAR